MKKVLLLIGFIAMLIIGVLLMRKMRKPHKVDESSKSHEYILRKYGTGLKYKASKRHFAYDSQN